MNVLKVSRRLNKIQFYNDGFSQLLQRLPSTPSFPAVGRFVWEQMYIRFSIEDPYSSLDTYLSCLAGIKSPAELSQKELFLKDQEG